MGFIRNEEGWPNDPDADDIYEYIRQFAKTDYGQVMLSEIEEFGLPGVDSAVDLTPLQSMYFNVARNERQRRRSQ